MGNYPSDCQARNGLYPVVMDQEWATRFRERLKQSGMTMKAASLEAGLGETFVRDMLERGRVPSVDKLLKLAHVVGTTVSELLGESSAPPQVQAVLNPEAQLRSALLAYGVHRDYLDQALRAIVGFIESDDDDEKSEQGRSPARTERANRLPEKAQAK